MIKESELKEYFNHCIKVREEHYKTKPKISCIFVCFKCRQTIKKQISSVKIQYEHYHQDNRYETHCKLHFCDPCWLNMAGSDYVMIWDNPTK